MIRQHHNNSLPDSSPRLGATAWCVGALLALAIIALTHDRDYATARGLELSETGRGLEFKNVNESGVAAAAPIRLIGVGLFLSAGVVCLATQPGMPRLRCDSFTLLIVLALFWAFASWVWSVNRGATARELVRLSMFVAVTAMLAARFDLRRLCGVLVIALVGSVLAAVGYELVTGGFRPWQADYRLTGTLHSNALAIESSVVAIIAYAFALRGNDRRLLWYSVFVAAVTIILFTKTRTAVGTVVAGIVVIHLVGRPAREWLVYATSAASLLAAGFIAATVLDVPVEQKLEQLVRLGRNDENDNTLTGRVPLWEFIWRDTADRRLQGVGYSAFWLRERTDIASDTLGWFPRHSHSAYLETFATLGIVGLAVIVSIGVLALARAAALTTRFGRPEYYAAAAVLGAAFVNGITETAFVKPMDIGLVSGALAFGLVLLPAQRTAAKAALNSNNGTVGSASPFIPRRRNVSKFSPGRGRNWSSS